MAAAVAHGDVQVVVVERMQLIGPKVNPHIVWPKSGICAFDACLRSNRKIRRGRP
jgi:hypothetical protein